MSAGRPEKTIKPAYGLVSNEVVKTNDIASGNPNKNIKGAQNLFNISTKPNSSNIFTIINAN